MIKCFKNIFLLKFDWFKYAWLFIYLFILFFLGIIVRGPSISFFFDQKNGKATITDIQDNGRIDLHYFHQPKEKTIRLAYICYDKHKLTQLKSKSTWDILYSTYFSEQIAIIEVDGKPDPLGFILIVILTIPLLFFKYWKFD